MHASPSAQPRVLQVVLSLHPGGTERLVLEIVRRLRPEIPMAVCCLDDEGAWGASLSREGVAVTALHRRSGFHPSLGRAVAGAAARHQANVLHCHHYTPFVYAALARLWHRPFGIVFTEHGRLSDAPPSPKRRLANQLLARVPARVAAVSADLKRHIVAEGFPDGKVAVVYNGIDVGELPAADSRSRVRRSLGIGDDAIVVGTIARLDPVKDLETLLDAVRRVQPERPVTLLVIGDGDERARLEAHASDQSAIRFLGHREDARDLLAGCDLYANSSIHEGVSLTILEAMAAGLPVVATSVGGTPEILDRTCGRLVAPRDPAAFAMALTELAGDANLRKTLGAAARTRAETRFTIERMVAEYRDSYFNSSS